MNLELLGIFLAVVIHAAIFNQSQRPDRKKKLTIALCTIGLSILMFFIGLFLGLGGNYDFKDVAYFLMYAPIYMSLLSFIVYLPKGDN